MILGLDAGGTATRWALANNKLQVVAEGVDAGLTALLLNDTFGQSKLTGVLRSIKQAVDLKLDHLKSSDDPTTASLTQLNAGFTGIDGHSEPLAALISTVFGLPVSAVSTCSDVELAYRSIFVPSQGFVVYSGTGSIASYIDENNLHHRAGGRGVYLDDGGGGYWIAREALRAIWRQEDIVPGFWKQSVLANAVFDYIGTNEWGGTRQFFYAQERGMVGMLAKVVADCANQDPVALKIMEQAGQELARLAQALICRFGPKPVALLGRAARLHPAIQQHFDEQILLTGSVEILSEKQLQIALPAHHAATLLTSKSKA
jgi:glucosamine kinase